MRIIGGRLKRRKLHSPPDATTTRPLPDRVRESMFNLLRGHFEGVAVLDAFAGTGSFGLEAISRGATRAILVERDRKIASLLEQNIRDLGVQEEAELVVGDALGPACLARCPRPLHVAMMDPPYALVKELVGWERVRQQMSRVVSLLDDTGFAMVRTPWPFWHEVEAAPGVADTPPTDAGTTTGVTSEEHAEELELSGEALDALDELEDELAAAAGATRLVRRSADLSIEGAIGPETHVYGHTAVHLYMKRRPAAPAPTSGGTAEAAGGPATVNDPATGPGVPAADAPGRGD